MSSSPTPAGTTPVVSTTAASVGVFGHRNAKVSRVVRQFVQVLDETRGRLSDSLESDDDEFVSRWLDVTREVLDVISDHYPATRWRRLAFTKRWNQSPALSPSVVEQEQRAELSLVSARIRRMPKVSTPWSYRQWLLQLLVTRLQVNESESTSGTPPEEPSSSVRVLLDEELEFVASTFTIFGTASKSEHAFAKNYSAWSYRRWLVETFGLDKQKELAFTTARLCVDSRNHCAWAYRWRLLESLHLSAVELSAELRGVCAWLEEDLENVSAAEHLYLLCTRKLFGAEQVPNEDQRKLIERLTKLSSNDDVVARHLTSLRLLLDPVASSPATLDRV